ncbi:hypothetical protein GCM10028812_52800 [Ancylobacter sonchi]
MIINSVVNNVEKTIIMCDRNTQIWIDNASKINEMQFISKYSSSSPMKINNNKCDIFYGSRSFYLYIKTIA